MNDFIFSLLYWLINIFRKAIQKNSLPSNTNIETFIREQIKAYLISHGHLDHISGFIINSPNDKSGKFIIGLNQTINIIQKSYFNNQAWADFGPKGLKVIKNWKKKTLIYSHFYFQLDIWLSNIRSTIDRFSPNR